MFYRTALLCLAPNSAKFGAASYTNQDHRTNNLLNREDLPGDKREHSDSDVWTNSEQFLESDSESDASHLYRIARRTTWNAITQSAVPVPVLANE